MKTIKKATSAPKNTNEAKLTVTYKIQLSLSSFLYGITPIDLVEVAIKHPCSLNLLILFKWLLSGYKTPLIATSLRL